MNLDARVKMSIVEVFPAKKEDSISRISVGSRGMRMNNGAFSRLFRIKSGAEYRYERTPSMSRLHIVYRHMTSCRRVYRKPVCD